jgi:hypothetical protein
MTPEQVFSMANAIAVLCWILLAVLPGPRWVTAIVTGTAMPVSFALLYVAIVAAVFGGAQGSYATLAGVRQLFMNPWLLVAGWVHYLAFDLLIGTWEVRDAREQQIPHLLVVPCLALTLMFGPAGWLLYRIVRAAHSTRRYTPA